MCGKRKKKKRNKKENLKAHVWSDWCATAWCWEVGCRILYIKFVGAAVIFVKIARPQISAGMGLNLSHEQVSQCLSFAAKLGIGKNTFFFSLMRQSTKGNQSSRPKRQAVFCPMGWMNCCSLWRPALCVLGSEKRAALLPKGLPPSPGCFQHFY